MANEFLRNREDAAVNPAAKALPSSAGSEVSLPIDLGPGGNKGLMPMELEIQAPVLDATELPDAATTTYDLEQSSDDSTYVDLANGVGVQTGASAAGAASANYRFGLPGDVLRYVRVKATSANTPGDQSGKTVQLAAKF